MKRRDFLKAAALLPVMLKQGATTVIQVPEPVREELAWEVAIRDGIEKRTGVKVIDVRIPPPLTDRRCFVTYIGRGGEYAVRTTQWHTLDTSITPERIVSTLIWERPRQ